jgi:hypothetical protein
LFTPPYNEEITSGYCTDSVKSLEKSGVPLDLKTSLNLPKTAFPMKANLPQNEPKMLERW